MGGTETGSGGKVLVKAVQSLYMECEVRVEVEGKHSEWFKVDQDLKQGCTLSPSCYLVTT